MQRSTMRRPVLLPIALGALAAVTLMSGAVLTLTSLAHESVRISGSFVGAAAMVGALLAVVARVVPYPRSGAGRLGLGVLLAVAMGPLAGLTLGQLGRLGDQLRGPESGAFLFFGATFVGLLILPVSIPLAWLFVQYALRPRPGNPLTR